MLSNSESIPLPYPDFEGARAETPYQFAADRWDCEVACSRMKLIVVGRDAIQALTRALALANLINGGLWMRSIGEIGPSVSVVGVGYNPDGSTRVTTPPADAAV